METAQHTPEPWQYRWPYIWVDNNHGTYRMHVTLNIEGHTNDGGYTPMEELQANGRLMAAAPDLLAALQEVRFHCPDLLQKCEWSRDIAHSLTGKGKGTMLDLVDVAIARAKATGQTACGQDQQGPKGD